MTENRESVFGQEFTGKYSLSKTLRFELRPTSATRVMLEENHVFEIDKNKYNKYLHIKPWFDRLHREFVDESMHGFVLLHLDEYLEKLNLFEKNKKDKGFKASFDKIQEKLRKEIVNQFDVTAKKWSAQYDSLKKKDVGIFSEEGIFEVLAQRYGNNLDTMIFDESDGTGKKKVSIFSEWKGFTGYFSKFHATRTNFYKHDGTSTALATRMIDQNLRRFCANIKDFKSLKSLKEKLDLQEIENNFSISCDTIFTIEFYNTCLTQNGIDFYNKILGGELRGNGEKLRGINELVNEYRQKNNGESVQFLSLLDKQILSEKTESHLIGIQNTEELRNTLVKFNSVVKEKTGLITHLIARLTKSDSGYDFEKIYLSKESLNTISQRWFSEREVFEKTLFDILKGAKAEYDVLRIEKNDPSISMKEGGEFSFPNFIKLIHIKEALEAMSLDENTVKIWKNRYYSNETKTSGCIEESDRDFFDQFLRIFQYEIRQLVEEFQKYTTPFEELIASHEDLEKDTSKAVIKSFADTSKFIYQMGMYFAVEKKRNWLSNYELCNIFYKDTDFGYLKFYEDAYAQIVRVYDDIRNFLTKKPYNEVKWKLNFENSTLAGGWDVNKESDNSAVILRNDDTYYLGLMANGNNKIFSDKNLLEMQKNIEKGRYEKMIYKYFPDASKMIPKCSTQLNAVKNHFKEESSDFKVFKSKDFICPVIVSRRVHDLNNIFFYKENITKSYFPQSSKEKSDGVKMFQKDFVKNGGDANLYKAALYDWIEFCREFLKAYKSTSIFDYTQLRASDEYESLDKFYKDINKLTYSVSFQGVSEEYISKKNDAGELYLFEIHNKDWNLKDGKQKSGVKNLHTTYFETLFSKDNKSEFLFKLNGQAEIFFRPKTSPEKLGHRLDKNGKDVVMHRRYVKDTILFHCPITLNRGAGDMTQYSFNQKTNEFLAQHPEINIIGIDRGEKHLAYYSVINQKQEILEIGSLNYIQNHDSSGKIILKNGKRIEETRNESGKVVDYVLVETGEKVDAEDYKLLLEYKEKKRLSGRQNWNQIEGIKDLKKGYISQVVRKLSDMIIQYNAIIVFEDLNMRFKQVRSGIEKSVYQQLEKALIDKLNFLVDKKELDSERAGHLLRAYQLTAPFTTFRDMGKQTGIIFYTQAEYTSTTDPLTGFRKNLYISNSATQKKIIDAIDKFDAIGWDEKIQSYFFTYSPIRFTEKKFQDKTFDQSWTVYANVPRVLGRKNDIGKWESKEFNPNEMIQKLLSGWGFEDVNVKDLKKSVLSKKEDLTGERNILGKKRNFFQDFIFIFNLILQLRNSFSKKPSIREDGSIEYEGEDIDFIASPVYPFFTTKSSKSNSNFTGFEERFIGNESDKHKFLEEFNGDANGAYNIARKGIMILQRLGNEKQLSKDGLYIHKHQWDEWTHKMYQLEK